MRRINPGIIIQARVSSTRLPNKILLDFYNGKNILEIIYARLVTNTKYPVIIATTINEKDMVLVDFCKNKNMDYYRGSEQDVLLRFIEAAESYQFTHIIRICSDNPFLYYNDINRLGTTLLHYPEMDYISFKIGEKPSILTHYGFFAELASLDALYEANKSLDSKHHEHLTNYLYTNEDKFKIKWLSVRNFVEENKHIRLTIDDNIDFINAQSIYAVTGEDFTPESIVKIVNSNPDIKRKMIRQILKNSK